jgi:isopentenyl-diphosphate delta-isomerase
VEQVVLLDEGGAAVGVADKATVHHRETPLHLAFSAYVFNGAGELLMTRRADTKRTWPGVWTNSCCGHPQPGEVPAEAVGRRLEEELGIRACAIDLVLPRFRYRAVMPNGIVENEMCPVFRVRGEGEPVPDAAEVGATAWVPWRALVADVLGARRAVSPWSHLQIGQLDALGPDPSAWRVGAADELPPAARVRQRLDGVADRP